MGYTTEFCGNIYFNIDLTDDVVQLLHEHIARLEVKRLCYCPWSITLSNDQYVLKCEDGKSLNYIDWLDILIDEFSNLYILNGEVYWRGEDYTDNGKLVVRNNKLIVYNTKYVKK